MPQVHKFEYDPSRSMYNRPYMMNQPQFPAPPNPSSIRPPDTKHLPFKDIEKYLIDAKYFMIKSANYNNIEKSINFCEWATTKSNEVLY